jgi:translation elongation factor EF-4
VIPVINKIDLPGASIDLTRLQLTNTLKFQNEEILEISAKNGINIEKVLNTVLKKVRPPSGRKDTLSR